MATTYSELKTEIADFLNRDDLTSAIPTFIKLAESQINRDIRHWKMEKRATANLDSEYSGIPADWLETIQMHVTGNGTQPLQLVSREHMAAARAGTRDTGGIPTYYTHADGQFELYPTPGAATGIELLYYGKVPALSDSNATNWLLTDAPDVYLYGSLIHTAAYLQEDARAATWAQLYGAAITKLNEQSESARYSGSGLKLKVRGLG